MTDGPPQVPTSLNELPVADVLASIDRDISFYRHRAGQVFFLGVLAEILILAGRERVLLPEAWVRTNAVVYTLFFASVAAVGFYLGWLYRRRIRHLKAAREQLLAKRTDLFPPLSTHSEIKALWFTLGFLSVLGIALTWLRACAPALP
jgi:hypothetical protein